jgi:hypothetical protein
MDAFDKLFAELEKNKINEEGPPSPTQMQKSARYLPHQAKQQRGRRRRRKYSNNELTFLLNPLIVHLENANRPTLFFKMNAD